MTHEEVIALVAGVLEEEESVLKLSRIHELLVQKSESEQIALPGQGSRGNLGVHLSEATYPDIRPVKRMGRGLYGLEGRD